MTPVKSSVCVKRLMPVINGKSCGTWLSVVVGKFKCIFT